MKKRGEISENDVTLVRWDKSLIEKIHDTSIETGDDFKNEDIFDIIENIKKEHTEQKDKQLLEFEEIKNIELKEEVEKRQSAEIKNKNYSQQIRKISRTISHLIASFLSLLTVYFLIKALYISTPNVPLFEKDMIDFNTSWATLPVAILLLFTLLGLLFGTSVKSLYRWIQTGIKSRIINFFEK